MFFFAGVVPVELRRVDSRAKRVVVGSKRIARRRSARDDDEHDDDDDDDDSCSDIVDQRAIGGLGR